MEGVTQLGYLGLGVSNLETWARFATQVLGLEIKMRQDDGSLFLRMDEYHHRFVVHPTGADDLAYVGWEVPDEHALRATADRLKAAGVAVTEGTEAEAKARRVVGFIMFEDPNRIRSELFYGPLMGFEQPFKSPRAISGFEAGAMGLGHIVLAVDDLERSVQFYRDVLGMRISDFIVRETAPASSRAMAFFHCNPRHHSLAFYAAAAPRRLQHFMLQAKSVDDVGATWDLCQDEGVPIARGLGRHTNDHMVSLYLRSPSGFEVEYGWGGRVVDDNTWRVQHHTRGSIWGHRPLLVAPG